MQTPPLLYSVVIPNWCGGDMLRRGLHALFAEARGERAARHAFTFEVIVCDDASPDGDGERLRHDFPPDLWPELRVIQRERNGGFGPTVNEGCQAARGALLCLCNNDLAPQAGYFGALLQPLIGDSPLDDWQALAGMGSPITGVAATTARTEDATGRANHAAMRGQWRGGRMMLHWRERPLPGAGEGEPVEVDFLQAGAAAIRVGAYRALGGMDNLFAPGYWEDYDFSQRLRRAGGRILHTPAARAFHLGKSSMTRKHGAGRVRDLNERNRLLFEWRHAPTGQRGWRQACTVAGDVAAEWRTGGPFHLTKGLLMAWRQRDHATPALAPPPTLPLQGFVPVEA